MIYPGFCGPSNPSQSVVANTERLVNWYVERVDAVGAPTGAALYPTPGAEAFVGTTDVGTRALFSIAGRTFAVIGGHFWELYATQTATLRGNVLDDGLLATISYNRASGELFITSGNNGYTYTLATNTLTLVLTNEATMGGMKDGYFLAFNRLNGRVRESNLNDGLTWGALNYFERSIAPDPWQAMIVANPYIWLIGEQTGEAWYNTGAWPQPFAPVPGAFFPYGTAAPWSVGAAGEMIVWLANTQQGGGLIVGATGYQPRSVSNYAVETALSDYRRIATIDDCELLAYRQDGHLFAVFSFPSANATWGLDVETGQWHERGTWHPPANQYHYWHPRVCCKAFGKVLIGERETGAISELDVTFGSENAHAIRRLRVGSPLWASSNERLVVNRFGLFMDTGVGVVAGQGVDPTVRFRVSYDGKTWGTQRDCQAGAMGQYGRHVEWRRCGSSTKLWIPEIVVSDPVPWRIAGAEIDGTGIGLLAKAS